MTISPAELTALERELFPQPEKEPDIDGHAIPPEFASTPQEPIKPEPVRPAKKRSTFTSVSAVLEKLDKNDNGKVQSNLKNAINLLHFHPAWNAPTVLQFDEFKLEIVTANPTPWEKPPGTWKDVDDIAAAFWFQKLGVIVSPTVAHDAIDMVASENSFHPIRNYLNGLRWDRRKRVGKWLTTYLGAEDNFLNQAMGQAWLVGAVKRVCEPGCQMDYTLCLEGKQGLKKSSALATLAGHDFFMDHLSDLEKKDARVELLGRWIVELSELDNLRGKENSVVKSFLTCRSDVYRPPYGRRAIQIPRQCVFAATSNAETPFSDSTGNRRFWPVSCGDIDLKQLKADRDQIWAEAYYLYRNGAVCYLASRELEQAVEEEQARRLACDPWEQIVMEWAENPRSTIVTDAPLLSEVGRLNVGEILLHAIRKPRQQWHRTDESRIGSILAKNGYERKRVRLKSKEQGRWFYVKPAAKD